MSIPRLELRHLLWLSTLALLVLFLWQPWQKGHQEPEDQWLPDLGALKADLTFEGIRYSRNTGGKTQWVLDARVGRLYQADESLDLEGVKLKFLAAKGGPVTVLADTGHYETKKDALTLKGHVRIASADGRTLLTDTIHLDQAKGIIWTRDDVLIKGPGLTLQGKGLEYDIEKGKLTVQQQTTVLPEGGTVAF